MLGGLLVDGACPRAGIVGFTGADTGAPNGLGSGRLGDPATGAVPAGGMDAAAGLAGGCGSARPVVVACAAVGVGADPVPAREGEVNNPLSREMTDDVGRASDTGAGGAVSGAAVPPGVVAMPLRMSRAQAMRSRTDILDTTTNRRKRTQRGRF